MTITAFNEKNGKLEYAGLHQDILRYRKKSKEIEIHETHGMWLGMLESIEEYNLNYNLNLNNGDTVLLFTDGITEAIDKTIDQLFSNNKLINIFAENGDKPLEEIKDVILKELDGYFTDDDVTFVLFRKK